MKRGDLVTYAGPGDYGKPRPVLIVQSDYLLGADSIIICLLTSDDDVPLGLPRVEVLPSAGNGLARRSLVMVEKLLSAKRSRCGRVIGRLEEELMNQVDAALALVIGLLD